MRVVAFLIDDGIVVEDELEVEDGEVLRCIENDGVLGFTQNFLIFTNDGVLV
jgi:hypothetical protein